MSENPYVYDGSISINKMPELSDWKCYLTGYPESPFGSLVLTPTKGNEPNWFHRNMQELILGFKWRKRK